MKKSLLVLTTLPSTNKYQNYTIVNLGPWCKNKCNIELNRTEGSNKILIKDVEFADKFIELILGQISISLNSIHNKDYSSKYWRALLSSWLSQFIGTVSDRINALEYASKKNAFDLVLLSKNSKHVVPENPYHSMKLAAESDSYNQYLFQKVFNSLFEDDDSKKKWYKSKEEEPVNIDQNLPPSLALIKRFVIFTLMKLFSQFRDILVTNTAISLTLQKKMLFKAPIAPFISYNDFVAEHIEVNSKIRESLENDMMYLAKNRRERLTIQLICSNLPKIFVENYVDFVEYSSKLYNLKCKKLFIGVELFNNSAFSHFIGESREEGATVKGIQHGGRSGTEGVSIQEIVEHKNVDSYYTWGWNWMYFRKSFQLLPMPSPKLIDHSFKNIHTKIEKKSILFGITSVTKFTSRVGPFDNTYTVKDYIDRQNRFVSCLNNTTFSRLLFRAQGNERDWNYSRIIKSSFPDIAFDNIKQPFSKSLFACQLYVSDHLSTTWLESLVINKPTILFWNDIYALNIHTKKYFKKLKEVGILHDTPESAAKTINNIHDNIEEWWMDDCRQKVVLEICNRFAFMPKKPLDIWVKELNNF